MTGPATQPETQGTTLVSVTRFRLRALRFLPFFMLHANRSIAQIRKSDGFLAGAVQREAGLAFWTLTVWRDAHAMRAFAASGAHRTSAPHLANWADAARVAHWLQPGCELPAWPEAVRRLREEGRSMTLRYPAVNAGEEGCTEPRIIGGMRL